MGEKRRTLGITVPLLKQAFHKWLADNAPYHAAALAYYTLFSLVPLIVVIVSIGGLVTSRAALTALIIRHVTQVAGARTAHFLSGMILSAINEHTGLGFVIFGAITLIFGAVGLISNVRYVLNIVWEVKPDQHRSRRVVVWQWLLSLILVVALGVVLVVSQLVAAGLTYLGHHTGVLSEWAPYNDALQLLNVLITIGLLSLVFMYIYAGLPDTDISWRNVWVGSVITAVLFVVGNYGLRLYFEHSGIRSVYGAAGSLVVILLWANYAAQVFLFSAELTRAHAQLFRETAAGQLRLKPVTQS